jgi:hypothetical protein
MKKLLLVLAIGAFVACNDSGSSTDTPADSSATAAPDTSMQAAPDTTHIDTTGAMPADTSMKK